MDNGLVPFAIVFDACLIACLNPCCSGQWSRTWIAANKDCTVHLVLILVVVDNGLVPMATDPSNTQFEGLNPCCSGQWSRTGEKVKDSVAETVS